jgi:CRP-like cAMP-binding protein
MSEAPANPAPLSAEEKRRLLCKIVAEVQVALQARDFRRADALRDKLVEVDPMALGEIIKVNGMIEEEKSAAIDRDHLAIWSKLYDDLSEEERNCLFYSMKKVVVPPKKLLLSHGAMNSRLFFIDRGQVTIFFPKGDQNVVLAQLGRGDILGEYTFATISLCSASAVTHTEVELMCLENSATAGWEEQYPGLYGKLIDFCMKNGRVDEILRNKKMEKRQHVRYLAEGVVNAVVLTREGQKSDIVFRGSLTDISMAGTCFAVRINKKATAKALLARHLLLSFSCGTEDNPLTFQAVGKVVRVSFHLYEDYSVHVQFNKHLPEEKVKSVATGKA